MGELGVVQTFVVSLTAEAYDIAVDVKWPNPEVDGLDFGAFKVHYYTTTILHYYTTTLLHYYYSTILLYYYTTNLLLYYTTTLLYYATTASTSALSS